MPSVHHDFESEKSASSDETEVDGPKWNADHDVDDGAIDAAMIDLSGAVTGTTVGAAGAAAALPDAPLGYVTLPGTAFLVPYYSPPDERPTLRSVGAPSFSSSGGTNTVAKPDGLTIGDVMIMAMFMKFNGGMGLPDDWTSLVADDDNNLKVHLLYRIANADDVAGSGWEITGTGNQRCSACCAAFYDSAAPSAVGQAGATSTAGGLSGWTAPVVAIIFAANDFPFGSGALTDPAIANFSPSWSVAADGTDGTDGELAVFVSDLLTPSAATGVFSFADSNGGDSNGILAALIPQGS
jgi:hypothetical protein